jgi:hypothetical protein
METIKTFLLGVLTMISAALFFWLKRPRISAEKEMAEVVVKLDEIKEKANETDLSQLVDKSNDRYRDRK